MPKVFDSVGVEKSDKYHVASNNFVVIILAMIYAEKFKKPLI